MLKIRSSVLKLADSGYDYSSTQINFSTAIANQVIEWGKKNISNEDIYTEDDKYGREKEIHCTVKYGLHSSNVEPVRSKIENFGSFDIKLGKISRFVSKDKPYNVVKIEVESEELHELHRLLSELPNGDEHPVYHPHTTIAYVKSGSCSTLSGKRPFSGLVIPVTNIVFSPADGDPTVINLEN